MHWKKSIVQDILEDVSEHQNSRVGFTEPIETLFFDLKP